MSDDDLVKIGGIEKLPRSFLVPTQLRFFVSEDEDDFFWWENNERRKIHLVAKGWGMMTFLVDVDSTTKLSGFFVSDDEGEENCWE